jgi:hypothetical protein
MYFLQASQSVPATEEIPIVATVAIGTAGKASDASSSREARRTQTTAETLITPAGSRVTSLACNSRDPLDERKLM